MPRVVSASIFFPRGGSAYVLRSLARELPAHGWDVTIVSGSRHDGHQGDARAFYAGFDLHEVDFTTALAAPDPMDPPAGAAPMHPSYEDRLGAPDRIFAALDDAQYERQVDAWAAALEEAGAATADVLHLSHLTPVNAAAQRVAPGVPVVGHLHGTELLMLERIAAGAPAGWTHAEAWARRLRGWAQSCARLILLSSTQVQRAVTALGIDPDRCTVMPNGYDPAAFAPAEEPVDRVALWRRCLVAEPRGWRPGRGAGSVAYAEEDLAAFAEGPTLLYVGRFTEVKRVGLMIAAYARARERFATRAPLVVVGGHAGEWEGEHPFDTIRRLGVPDVFLAGWHEHNELAALLHASDALVLASVREQFGQVIVEAMACGLPPIAVDRFGPSLIIRDGETGWLVEPDDEAGLAAAMVQAVDDGDERRRRGRNALEDARAHYSWPAIAGAMAATLEEALVPRDEMISGRLQQP
ncbi:glycosyltransferase family 4 protein [Capillimicrobium parvum]|uniref:D-inositol-3-phosphate glycosyltransferase n=1 Tax=Capillimicrobium parvum TaxID=2884022 RepID=A0A9E6XYC2_9ACTN|nr:glycosyltransferase family 4 protein [Capillimicrobium parvum]UGS36641.1 D-inositol-3-phosphate glycosyltransferase [Capillimicrobium parvum]